MPDGTKVTAGFFDVNANDKQTAKTGRMTPKCTSAMTSKLKIGDRLKLDFVYLGNRRWLTNVTPLRIPVNVASTSGNTEDTQEMSFRISSLRSLTFQGKRALGLRATKGTLSWTFLVPLVSNPETGRGQPDEVSDPDMVKLIRQYLPGEEVCIDYETVDYAFVIKSIRPAVVQETGRVVAVGDKSLINPRLGMMNVPCPQARVLATPGGARFLLVRPDDTLTAGLPKAAEGLGDMVKSLEKDQTIQYKYYRQAGVRWLIEAQMVDNNIAASR